MELKEVANDPLTVDQLKLAVPASLKGAVTPELVKQVNDVMTDPQLRDHFRDNLLGFSSVLQEGKFKLLDYINATRYVCYKGMGDTNELAYCKTFPDRYQILLDKELSKKDISAYVSSYNSTKLVTLMLGQVLVPMHIMYDDLRHKMIGQLAHLAVNSSSEKVQSDSADRLLTHLKPPEETKLRLSINTSEGSDAMASMQEDFRKLAATQQEMIRLKMTTAKDVAESKVVSTMGKDD